MELDKLITEKCVLRLLTLVLSITPNEHVQQVASSLICLISKCYVLYAVRKRLSWVNTTREGSFSLILALVF